MALVLHDRNFKTEKISIPYLVFILKHKYRRVWCIKYGAEVSFFVHISIETVSNNKVILFAQQKNHFFSKSTLTMAKTRSIVKKAAEKRKKAPLGRRRLSKTLI